MEKEVQEVQDKMFCHSLTTIETYVLNSLQLLQLLELIKA